MTPKMKMATFISAIKRDREEDSKRPPANFNQISINSGQSGSGSTAPDDRDVFSDENEHPQKPEHEVRVFLLLQL